MPGIADLLLAGALDLLGELGGWILLLAAGYYGNEFLRYSNNAVVVSWRLRKFREVFGGHIRSEEDIRIVVPVWRALEAGQRFEKHHLDESVIRRRGPDWVFARDDVQGADRISDLFSRVLKRSEGYVSDSDKVEWARLSMVIVGSPAGNAFALRAMEALAEKPRRMCFDFALTPDGPDDPPNQLRDLYAAEGAENAWEDQGSTEHAFVMRTVNPFSKEPGRHLFFVAGNHAAGTLAAATYLSDNWKTFARAENPAGVLLKLDRRRPETASPIQTYIKKRPRVWRRLLPVRARSSGAIATEAATRREPGSTTEAQDPNAAGAGANRSPESGNDRPR